MAANKHIEQIGDTDANIRANLDSLQIAIQTDDKETFVWADEGADKYFYAARQYSKVAGGAKTYLDNEFNKITLHGNLIIPDAGNIGSVSDTDAMAIGAGGIVSFSAGINNSGASLLIQDDAAQNVEMFASATGGETPTFKISGFRNVDAKRTLTIGVSGAVNDALEFKGLSDYIFDGDLNIPAGGEIGCTGDFDLMTLAVGALTVAGSFQSTSIGCGIAPDPTTIGKFYRDDASTAAIMQIEQDGTGDASLAFGLTGGQFYSIGIDNSETGDVLKISPAAAHTATEYWNMIGTGQVGIGVKALTAYQLYVNQTLTVAAEVADGAMLALSDITNNNVAGYQAIGLGFTLNYRGTQGSTDAKGCKAMEGNAYNYNTGTTTHFGGLRFDTRNLDTGTVTNLFGNWIIPAVNTGGGTVDNFYGYKCDAQTVGTNNYGFWSNIAAAANRYNFYAPGTASNYFAGSLGLGVAPLAGALLTVEGTIKLDELAAAGADSAGYGQMWVKNTTPCALYFTDDAGLDTQLTNLTKVQAADTTPRSIANGIWTTTIYSIEDKDVLGEYDNATGIFTATYAGTYVVSWGTLSASVAWAQGEYWLAALSKNNSVSEGDAWSGYRWHAHAAHTGYASSVGSATINLVATDTLRIKILQNQGAAVNTLGNELYDYFHINRTA